MITEAIVIGAVEAAIFWEEDDNPRAVRLDPTREGLIDCSRDIGWLLSIGAEKRRLRRVPRDIEGLRAELRAWSEGHRALTMMIGGMDAELTDSTRANCISVAEESFRDPASVAFARARLLGCPLPEDADLDGSLRLSLDVNAIRAAELYKSLSMVAPHLVATRRELQRLLRYQFDDAVDPENSLRAIVDLGIVADALEAAVRRDGTSLNGLVFRYADDRYIAEVLPRAAHFLTKFVSAIKNAVEWEHLEPAVATGAGPEVPEARDDPLLEIIQDWKKAELASRSRLRRQPLRGSRYADDALSQVTRQKEFIIKNLRANRIDRAESAIHALVLSQQRNSTLAHLCKSLCDLGASATRLHLFALAQRLYEAARVANDRDAVPVTGYAETLRQMGRLEEALAAYGDARAAFPHEAVPVNGYAETLRQMGRLEEALAAYGDARAAFPHEAVPVTGYAETLRQMGRLEEALAAYGDARAAFPHEAVPVTGYAETLRQMGRLEEALAAYGDARAAFPHDVYTVNGYAETLRQMGRLEEALAAYGDARAAFPHEAVPVTGYAETLRQMGRLEEALAAYGDARAAFPHEVVPVNGYAETLRQMGRLEEALAAYGDARAAFPHEVYTVNGYAETLRQMGRLEEALAAYGDARAAFPHEVYTVNGYAETLRQMGRLEEALAAYGDARAAFPHEVVPVNGYAETLRQMGRLEEAKREFRGALTQFPNERVAKNALACLLIEAGETSEARPLLAVPDPKTEQDWRDYHVAAMAYIKDGNYEEAEKLLGDGAQAVPFYSAREVFRASLAYVKLLRRQYQAASSLIGSDNVHNFRPPTVAVIDAHASAALGHLDRAQESLFDAERSRSNAVIHLADFIRKRYSLGIYVGQLPDNEEAGLLDGAIAEAEFELALRIAA